MRSARGSRLKKGEFNDGEFEEFLAELGASLEQSVGRLGVAGHLSAKPAVFDAAKTISVWPDISDRIIEEMR